MSIVKREKKENTSLTEQVREAPSLKREIFNREKPVLLIPTGSTVLNLTCSSNPIGGYCTGTMVNVIGDSSAGKSLQALTMLAEVCNLEEFDDYLLYYDDVEAALKFNVGDMFGKKLEKRIKTDIRSKNAEMFYGNFMKLLNKGKKFIYVVDSWDALRTIEEEERANKFIKLTEENKEVDGTYGQSKQKLASEIFRVTCGELESTDSFLYIISQVRANLRATMFGNPRIRSGGMALKFYATHELWLSVKKHLKKNDRTYGINCLTKISKNKLNGREDEVEFPIYYNYGIDDIGSCIEFLVQEKFWKRSKGVLTPDDQFSTQEPIEQETFIQKVEESPELLKELRLTVSDAWKIIDDELKIKRKKKYE